jgi:hypothetical protein
MAIKIGGLYADLILKDGDFRTRMNRAERHVKRLSKEVGATLGPALRGAGIAAIGAGVAMAYSMKKAADEIDTLAKNADRLGIIPEQLKAMQIAADFSGVDSATLVKGFKELVTAGVEAGRGSKPIVDAFAALGIEVKAFNALKPQEQLELVADRIAGLGSAAEQASIAQALFGKAGFELLPVLKEGGAGFARAADLAKRYGLAIDRIDAGTVEAANDAITQAGLAWEGLSSQLAVQAAPAITQAIKQLDQMIDRMGGMESIAGKIGTAFVSALKPVIAGIQITIGWLQTAQIVGLEVIGRLLEIRRLQQIASGDLVGVAESTVRINQNEAEAQAKADSALVNLQGRTAVESLESLIKAAQDAAARQRREQARDAMNDEANKARDQFNANLGTFTKAISEAGKVGRTKSMEEASGGRTSADDLEQVRKRGNWLAGLEETTDSVKTFSTALTKATASFLSASEIAGSARGGTSGYNRTLANRVERLRERAAIAEASGRFAAADTLNAQAQELDSRIKRRARDADGNVLPMSVIPGADGNVLPMSVIPGADGNVLPMSVIPDADGNVLPMSVIPGAGGASEVPTASAEPVTASAPDFKAPEIKAYDYPYADFPVTAAMSPVEPEQDLEAASAPDFKAPEIKAYDYPYADFPVTAAMSPVEPEQDLEAASAPDFKAPEIKAYDYPYADFPVTAAMSPVEPEQDLEAASIDSTEPPTVETSKGDGGGLVAEVRALVQALNGAAQKLGIA